MDSDHIFMILIAAVVIGFAALGTIVDTLRTPEQICAARSYQTEYCLNLSKSKMNEGKN